MNLAINLNDVECEFKDEILNEVSDIFLDRCLTCGTCSGGCPGSGLMGMDPRKLLRMITLGMDKEVKTTKWAWVCTMCARCLNSCPMEINIPKLIFKIRSSWPRNERPKGILGSCDNHINSGNAMGVPVKDFIWTVNDMADEIRDSDPRFKDLKVSVDRKNANIVLNQNSREPVTEPDELGPLWKILHTVGADWTYPSVMWGGENYCMFMADDEAWRYITEEFVCHVENNIGCRTLVNTE